jgi:hypothetical protein
MEENIEYQKKYSESNIVAQKEEAKMREKILTYHLKERTNDLNQLVQSLVQKRKDLKKK